METKYYVIVKKKPDSNTDKFRYTLRKGRAVGCNKNFEFCFKFGSGAFRDLMKEVDKYGEGFYYFTSQKSYSPGATIPGGIRYINDLVFNYYCSFEHPRTKIKE